MYVRPDGRRVSPKSISVPQNYSGNAFAPKEPPEEAAIAEEIAEPKPSDELAAEASKPMESEKKGFFSLLSGNDDLLLIGLILLLSQDGFGDDILPILLMILFLKK